MAIKEHVAALLEGADHWNTWRTAHPDVIPDLSGASFDGIDLCFADLSAAILRGASFRRSTLVGSNWSGADVTGANLKRANLKTADFSRSTLVKATLSGTDLSGAKFAGALASSSQIRGATLRRTNFDTADLSGANLSQTTIYQSSFRRASMRGADLSRASLVDVDLQGADMAECHVYGAGAWDLTTDDDTRMQGLIVSRQHGEMVAVDDIKVAQLVHLMLSSTSLRRVIATMSTSMVLVLGRFTPPRKRVLEGIRSELRKRGYVPVIFDFPNVPSRTLTETVGCLAHLSRFIVADITGARSIPQELMAVVPHLPSVPVQPLLLREEDPWGMFESFGRYGWVMPLNRYQSESDLLSRFDACVIEGPEGWLKES